MSTTPSASAREQGKNYRSGPEATYDNTIDMGNLFMAAFKQYPQNPIDPTPFLSMLDTFATDARRQMTTYHDRFGQSDAKRSRHFTHSSQTHKPPESQTSPTSRTHMPRKRPKDSSPRDAPEAPPKDEKTWSSNTSDETLLGDPSLEQTQKPRESQKSQPVRGSRRNVAENLPEDSRRYAAERRTEAEKTWSSISSEETLRGDPLPQATSYHGNSTRRTGRTHPAPQSNHYDYSTRRTAKDQTHVRRSVPQEFRSGSQSHMRPSVTRPEYITDVRSSSFPVPRPSSFGDLEAWFRAQVQAREDSVPRSRDRNRRHSSRRHGKKTHLFERP